MNHRQALPGEEAVHGAGAAGQQRHQVAALGLVQPVGVGDDAQPRAGTPARA
jgi:hypothetical protein